MVTIACWLGGRGIFFKNQKLPRGLWLPSHFCPLFKMWWKNQWLWLMTFRMKICLATNPRNPAFFLKLYSSLASWLLGGSPKDRVVGFPFQMAVSWLRNGGYYQVGGFRSNKYTSRVFMQAPPLPPPVPPEGRRAEVWRGIGGKAAMAESSFSDQFALLICRGWRTTRWFKRWPLKKVN